MIPSGMDYAEIVKVIREGIYHIDIPIAHALGNLNLYLFMGGEPALIDTGPYHPLLEGVIMGALRYLGVTELSRILITHSHIDHFGMAARLRSMTGARVVAHREERPRIENVREQLSKEYDCYASMASNLGFPDEIARSILGLAKVWIDLSEPCPLAVKLKGGETIKAGDRELEAVLTPGHTAGHLCFYEREEKLLFSGDHLMRTITPNPELYCPPRRGLVTGLPQFLDSLRILEGYDARCAYPGHGKPIKHVQRRVEFNLLHHRKRLEKTEEAVRKGDRTVWEVSLRLFPQIRDASPDVDHFLALKEALGHLLILEGEGAVNRSQNGNLWIFEPA